MPNIKNQEKRVLTNAKRTQRNLADRSELKTAIKNVISAVNAKDKETAGVALQNANKLLDGAVSANLKHKNYASRQKSRLQKAVNTLSE